MQLFTIIYMCQILTNFTQANLKSPHIFYVTKVARRTYRRHFGSNKLSISLTTKIYIRLKQIAVVSTLKRLPATLLFTEATSNCFL